jgi:hypothetical protein
MKVAEDRRTVRVRKTVRVPPRAWLVRFLLHPAGKALILLVACVMIASAVVFIHFYNTARILQHREFTPRPAR